METWISEWLNKKIQIAFNLNAGQCGGTYGEAAIILCAALNALAAEVWPGNGIDKKRFVELLIKFAPNNLKITYISIPLLLEDLKEKGNNSSLLEKNFLDYEPAQILTGDVDRLEGDIRTICPTLTYKQLRKFSYASLLYEKIRCGYAHEYKPGERAESWPMTQNPNAKISYLNFINNSRHIYFHFEWISELASMVAQAVNAITLPLTKPSKWWLQG